jgi:hypothetical protein
MIVHEGGCVGGAVKYETLGNPLRVAICHCRFCQRATGSAYMVEPIFRRDDLRVTKGSPATYHHRSEGSGKLVHVHFCAACGTKLHRTFERFAEICGVYAGTFDDPNWFEIGPENAKHIFIEVARQDTILPCRRASLPSARMPLQMTARPWSRWYSTGLMSSAVEGGPRGAEFRDPVSPPGAAASGAGTDGTFLRRPERRPGAG